MQFSVHTCCPQINAPYLLLHPFLVLSLSTASMLGFHNKRDLTAYFALSSPLSQCSGSLFFSCRICLLYLAFFINPPVPCVQILPLLLPDRTQMSNSSEGPLHPKPQPDKRPSHAESWASVPSDRPNNVWQHREGKDTSLLIGLKETGLSTNNSLAHKCFLWRLRRKERTEERCKHTDLMKICV